MNRTRFLPVCLLALLLLAVLTPASAERVSDVGFFFDTTVTITLYDADSTLMDDIWKACGAYERLLSRTIAGSDVDRINTSHGEPVQVSADTYDILTRARLVSEASGGAFSVTIAPVSTLWDFTGGTQRMPSPEELASALPLVDDTKLELLDDRTVRLPDGMMIDLGGIAKGYIANRIAEICRERASGGILNFGGNVYTVGSKPDGTLFRVGIRDPLGDEGSSCAVVQVGDMSVVTSGIYERFFWKDDVYYHHILDPETGISSDSDLASATIVHSSSMLADAYATACIVLGSEKALDLLTAQGLDGFLITRDGQYLMTPGFDEAYQLKLLVQR